MTLRIALFLSVLLHMAVAQVPLPGAAGTPRVPAGRERLELRLVDPVSALGPDVVADGATTRNTAARAEATGAGTRTTGSAAAAGPADPAPGADEAHSPARPAEDPPAGEGTGRDVATASAAARPDLPARRSPTLADLEAELGLDLSDVADQGQDQIFPVMLKVHLNGGRPSASTYRQLLRTYIDVLMGYPWAVQGDLSRNADVRFLALLQVEVGGDGRFRIASLLVNENVSDEQGRIEGFYRRLLGEVSRRPFLPPDRAGLEAPALLTFQILNPEATR